MRSEMKMYEVKQSDEVIVPRKAANKGAGVPAEPLEGRTSIKGNPQDQSTGRTQGRGTVPQAVERIRQAVCRQTPEIRAVCVRAHVRICAGGAGKPAFLPQHGRIIM